MFELIKGFPNQLTDALKIGENVSLKFKFSGPIKNVVVSGLGGSGIGGNLVAELFRNDLSVPVIVNKGYQLPAFADASTLLILCSYSGNTEETITCAGEAIKKGLHPICITSGGKLEEIATNNNFDTIKIPDGFPPRSCLGYSATQLFFILQHYGLITDAYKSALKQTASLLQTGQEQMMNHAKTLAAELAKKIIIVYAEEKYESVALRFKQQINENAKMKCWYNVFPELNHNELVGWREGNPNLGVLILRTGDEYKRNTRRILFTKALIDKIQKNVYEVDAKGKDFLEKHFYLIHWADWFSYYLALQQGYDPVEINVLNELKDHLSTVTD